jgi:hypothetical protein
LFIMVSADVRAMRGVANLLTNPWPALIAGLATSLASWVLYGLFEVEVPVVVMIALIATGAAVAVRPQSPLILGLAALSGLLAHGGMSWDSGRLLIMFLTVVAGLAAVLMLMPSVIRRVTVSLIIVFHFGGILTAVTSVPPQPWLSLLAWVYVYRPYLEFMYLNNAYHFYAPQPGPATFVWFYVRYEDGSGKWVKIPRREDHPLALEYQRRLSLTESVNQLAQVPISEELLQARRMAGNINGIPMYPGTDPYLQRREPNIYSKRMLETYARYVARSTPHPTDPDKKVKSVKIYRGFHDIPGARSIASGDDPDAAFQYYPYYQGEFDPEGHLLNPRDPYLYWLIPILRGQSSGSMSSGSFGAFRAGVGSARRAPEDPDTDAMVLLEAHAKLKAAVPEDPEPAPLPGPAIPDGAPQPNPRSDRGPAPR